MLLVNQFEKNSGMSKMHFHGAPFAGPAARRKSARPVGPYGTEAAVGTRKLFRQPSAAPGHVAETARLHGAVDPRRLALLSKLAAAMTQPASGIDTDNPNIPAGFTYLAQLAAHDITFNLTPFEEALDPARPEKNARQARLMLNTLYGMGPGVHPYLYNAPELGREMRGTLRLGQMRRRTSRCPMQGDPWIDLPRLPVEPLRQEGCPYSPYNLDGNVQRSVLLAGRHDTLAADSRNDDNVVLSQITVLFAILHNTIYNRLDEPGIRAKLPPHLQDPRLQFQTARNVVTLTYRRVLFNDLLRRLLDAKVYAYLTEHGPLEPDTESAGGVPLEFTHAAYRMGHAMVRPYYEMNDGVDADARSLLSLTESLALGSQQLSQELPLLTDWYAQWSKFFDAPGRTPQPSRRIGPHIVPLFGRNYQFPNEDGPDGKPMPGGLVYRDLVRGEEEGLMTPLALAYRLAPVMGPQFDPDAYVRDITDKLVGWLCGAGFTPEEIPVLAGTPPLTLFILVEAWCGPARGCRLGPLGSLIVGEVFFRAQAETMAALEQDHHVQAAAAAAFDGAPPATMSALIQQVAAWSPLEYRPLPVI